MDRLLKSNSAQRREHKLEERDPGASKHELRLRLLEPHRLLDKRPPRQKSAENRTTSGRE